MGARHTRLAAALAAAWEAEVVSARTLTELAERVGDPRLGARLRVLAAFCRAHASRLLARLAALGRGPLPVPQDLDLDMDDIEGVLRKEAAFAKVCAGRYETLAQMARNQADLSSAWVCELNRTEEEDRALELVRLIEEHRHPAAPAAEPAAP
jgi:hypothetical protein